MLPSEWCSPELIWLTKPNKAPDTPEHLRPIGLLSPTAKAAAASVRELLMPGIQRLLTAVPQFAYLANRDIYNALARVNGQLASIKHSLALTVSNRFVQRQRREEATGTGRWLQPISGGAVLSVALHKAFDLLTREQLQSTLSKIVADEGVKQTALLLHTKCQYLLFQEGKATAVDTTRGVRQGCRLAPALWSAVSGDLLHHMVQDPFTGPMTIFADDHLGAWTFHTQDDILAMERDVLKLFQVLSEAGMSVNPSKSKLIVKVKGAEAERYMAKRTAHIRGQPHWCFGEGSDRVEVPIVQEFVYLGTVVTLSRQSDRTVSHRLEEARKREGQLRKCIRSRSVLRAGTRVAIWRACVVASAMYGLLAQELTATNVTTIRQWYHKSLRAVTGMPMQTSGPNLVFRSRWRHFCSSHEASYGGYRAFRPDMLRRCLPPWSIGKTVNGTSPFLFKRTTLLSRRSPQTSHRFHVHIAGFIFNTPRPCANTRLASMVSSGGNRCKLHTTPLYTRKTACPNVVTAANAAVPIKDSNFTSCTMPVWMAPFDPRGGNPSTPRCCSLSYSTS